MEVGTLRDLDVKPGDVVEDTLDGMIFSVEEVEGTHVYGKNTWSFGMVESGYWTLDGFSTWRIVSRAADTPKLWHDMTDAEKGALLLAHHKGKVIEYLDYKGYWCEDFRFNPEIHPDTQYRVKPEPVLKTVVLTGGAYQSLAPTHRIIFGLIDGVPDCDSIKMEKL